MRPRSRGSEAAAEMAKLGHRLRGPSAGVREGAEDGDARVRLLLASQTLTRPVTPRLALMGTKIARGRRGGARRASQGCCCGCRAFPLGPASGGPLPLSDPGDPLGRPRGCRPGAGRRAEGTADRACSRTAGESGAAAGRPRLPVPRASLQPVLKGDRPQTHLTAKPAHSFQDFELS